MNFLLARILISLVATLIALPGSAAVRASIDAVHNGVRNIRRLPVHNYVEYYLDVTSDSHVPTDVAFEADVPGTVSGVNEFSDAIDCGAATDRPIRCTLRGVSSSTPARFSIVTTLDTPGTQTLTIRLDGNPQTYAIEIVDQPSVAVTTATVNILARRVEPGQLIRYSTFVFGGGGTASNVTVTWTLPEGGTFEQVGGLENCTMEATRATCTAPTLAVNESLSFVLDVRAPERRTGGEIVLHTVVTSNETDFDPGDNSATTRTTLVRRFTVTNTNDAGSGSLRQALLEAQTLCTSAPCTIDFSVTGQIRPLSQLPELRGWVKLDGPDYDSATQPRVEILGTDAGDAHGLVLGRGCEVYVYDLAITGFRRSALEVLRGPTDPACDPHASEYFPPTRIARNHLTRSHRGLMAVGTHAMTILDNTISHNVRSGIYATGGFYAEIVRNRIGGNGASGLFLDIGTRDYYAGGADVVGNAIVGNGEWAIARTNNGEIAVQRNAIALNRYQGIDVNLDFETPNRPEDDFTSVPNKPVLFSAQFNPSTGMTTVRGRVETRNPAGSGVDIDVYASRFLSYAGQASAEQWVGVHEFDGGDVSSDFAVEIPGDLRGLYITAATTRTHIVGLLKPPGDVSTESHQVAVPSDTSELSNVVVVQ